MKTPDWGKTAADFARHRAGFPESLFTRLGERGIGGEGQELLDVGTGTGSLGRGFARRGCRVTGLDPAEPLLEQARRLDSGEGLTTGYVVGRAEDTGFPDGQFDIVAMGQCFHWLDRPRATAEALRILKPGGWLVIAHFDWIPRPGNPAAVTEELILRHNPGWTLAGGNGLYPGWLADVVGAGFADVETFAYDHDVIYSQEDWRGRIRASAGVGGTLGADAVAAFDREHEELLRSRFDSHLVVPHRVFALIARRQV